MQLIEMAVYNLKTKRMVFVLYIKDEEAIGYTNFKYLNDSLVEEQFAVMSSCNKIKLQGFDITELLDIEIGWDKFYRKYLMGAGAREYSRISDPKKLFIEYR